MLEAIAMQWNNAKKSQQAARRLPGRQHPSPRRQGAPYSQSTPPDKLKHRDFRHSGGGDERQHASISNAGTARRRSPKAVHIVNEVIILVATDTVTLQLTAPSSFLRKQTAAASTDPAVQVLFSVSLHEGPT